MRKIDVATELLSALDCASYSPSQWSLASSISSNTIVHDSNSLEVSIYIKQLWHWRATRFDARHPGQSPDEFVRGAASPYLAFVRRHGVVITRPVWLQPSTERGGKSRPYYRQSFRFSVEHDELYGHCLHNRYDQFDRGECKF